MNVRYSIFLMLIPILITPMAVEAQKGVNVLPKSVLIIDAANTGMSVPNGVTTNGEEIYITDTDLGQIFVFDMNGNYVKTLGSYGTGSGQFIGPSSIIAADDHLFVADNGNFRIQILETKGTYIAETPIINAVKLAYGDSKIYAPEYGTDTVQIFHNNGTYIKTFGSTGTSPGQFQAPLGIASNGSHILSQIILGFRYSVMMESTRHYFAT